MSVRPSRRAAPQRGQSSVCAKKYAISMRGVLGAVRTVHGVRLDALGEVGADRAGAAFFGSVAPMISRFFSTAFSPSSTCTITGPEVMY